MQESPPSVAAFMVRAESGAEAYSRAPFRRLGQDGGFRRKKWLGIAQRYPSLTPDEQARMQRRMTDMGQTHPGRTKARKRQVQGAAKGSARKEGGGQGEVAGIQGSAGKREGPTESRGCPKADSPPGAIEDGGRSKNSPRSRRAIRHPGRPSQFGKHNHASVCGIHSGCDAKPSSSPCQHGL
jgi:hypothetical protein